MRTEPIAQDPRHRRMDTIHRARRTGSTLLLLASLVLICACGVSSGSGESSAEDSASSASDSSGGATAKGAGEVSSLSQSGGQSTTDTASTRRAVTPLSRSVVSTGQVSLHSSRLAEARAEVVRLVAGWGGTISDEQTVSDERGRIDSSTLSLRVPTARFAAAMDTLAGIGQVDQQSRSSEDVSTQVIDTDARVRAAERSIRSIEGLLGRATKLSDVIAIESSLARRQADLDSLKQQQAYLVDQTSLSTIAVTLSTPPRAGKQETRGFLAGLVAGWQALQDGAAVALTALGAILPFAVIALLLGLPLWLLLRRRRPVVHPAAEA